MKVNEKTLERRAQHYKNGIVAEQLVLLCEKKLSVYKPKVSQGLGYCGIKTDLGVDVQIHYKQLTCSECAYCFHENNYIGRCLLRNKFVNRFTERCPCWVDAYSLELSCLKCTNFCYEKGACSKRLFYISSPELSVCPEYKG